jgi:hypothetical protein
MIVHVNRSTAGVNVDNNSYRGIAHGAVSTSAVIPEANRGF